MYHPDHLRVELGRATLGPNNSHADFLPLFGVLLNVSVVHRRDCSHRLIEAGSKSWRVVKSRPWSSYGTAGSAPASMAIPDLRRIAVERRGARPRSARRLQLLFLERHAGREMTRR